MGDLLANGDGRRIGRYRPFIAQELAGYLRAKHRYYARERRWPENEF